MDVSTKVSSNLFLNTKIGKVITLPLMLSFFYDEDLLYSSPEPCLSCKVKSTRSKLNFKIHFIPSSFYLSFYDNPNTSFRGIWHHLSWITIMDRAIRKPVSAACKKYGTDLPSQNLYSLIYSL